MINWEKASAKDYEVVSKIAKRALELLPVSDFQACTMDIIATHISGCPLDLAKLLKADNSNFLHDICGINKHIDRATGKLQDCFAPRFAS